MKHISLTFLSCPTLLYNMSCCCCSVVQSCPTLCDPTDCSTPGLPILHRLPEFAQFHVHCISDAVQLSHPPMPSSPSALNLSQHQGFSNKSSVHIRCSKSWSFSFSIILPGNIQGLSPLRLTGLISLLSKGLSGVFNMILHCYLAIPHIEGTSSPF